MDTDNNYNRITNNDLSLIRQVNELMGRRYKQSVRHFERNQERFLKAFISKPTLEGLRYAPKRLPSEQPLYRETARLIQLLPCTTLEK